MLLSERRQVLLREGEGFRHAAAPDELYEPLLVQVERQRVLLLQNLPPREILGFSADAMYASPHKTWRQF